MSITIVVLVTFVSLLDKACSRRKIRDPILFHGCQDRCSNFNCACENEDWMSAEPECIPFTWLCDAEQDCSNKADEIDCLCPPGQLQCGSDRGGEVNNLLDVYSCVEEPLFEMLCQRSANRERQLLQLLATDHLDVTAFLLSACIVSRCDGFANCPDGSDEMNCEACSSNLPHRCHCNQPNEFKCGQGGTCYNDAQICDGRKDCTDGTDEQGCACKDDQFTCECYATVSNACQPKHVLRLRSSINPSFFGAGCIPMNLGCDAVIHCGDGSDEWGCTCDDDQFTCECYKTDPTTCTFFSSGCLAMNQKCDESFDCSDGSDEEGCNSCNDDQFTCTCKSGFCSGRRCIAINKHLDGVKDCDDGSDEPVEYFKRTKCGDCDVTIRRFNFIEQCNVYDDCDNSTCIVVPAINCTDQSECNSTHIVCASSCNNVNASQLCTSIFQCANGQLEIAAKFCNGNNDCIDRSDEMGNQPGFKCSSSFGRCVLPQINLYDDVAQCRDCSDLCSRIPCFECLDHRLMISQTQLCDGTIDCYDLPDECLCDVYLRKPVCEKMFLFNYSSQFQCGRLNPQCQEITSSSIETARCRTQFAFSQSNISSTFIPLPSLISCQNKSGEIRASTCDGRPECRDFSDECSCENPPSLCSDRCHNFYPLGDRYCDGIIDEAWKFINDSSCPEGFDEKSCPQRFTCKAGNLVSIDRVQVCDGKVDCDNRSDEIDCRKKSRPAIFSSQTEMIARIELRIIFWFMAFLVIIGNSAVIFSTIHCLCNKKMGKSQKFNHILLVNLSCSDLLMGIYLLIISVTSVQFSGFYEDFDYSWRSSLACSVVGSLAVISSETSCFIMTIITAFRLYNVCKPFAARTVSTLKWKLGISLAWSISLILALLPIFQSTSNYFVHEIWFSNKFTSKEGWNKTDVMTFACRLASLSNQTIQGKGDAWTTTRHYLRNNFPEYSPLGELGYYGETSICIPRIYTSPGDQAWVYSLVIITFNFISFLFVAISYLIIYYKSSNRPIRTSRSDEQDAQMQRRIVRLIATDFACWIPICIMVFLTVGGVGISDVVYIVTAGVLLLINSAVNPLLYTQIVEKMFRNFGNLLRAVGKLDFTR